MKLALHGVALAAVLALPTVAASAPDATTFPAEAAIPARLTLLPANGPIGRENPFYKGYRPTFIFPGAKDEMMCAIDLPGDREKVDPGESVEVALRCVDPVPVKPDALAFIFKEGGRKVGEGEVHLADH
jgi:translation elongation factor EF-Tu-like GTPase